MAVGACGSVCRGPSGPLLRISTAARASVAAFCRGLCVVCCEGSCKTPLWYRACRRRAAQASYKPDALRGNHKMYLPLGLWQFVQFYRTNFGAGSNTAQPGRISLGAHNNGSPPSGKHLGRNRFLAASTQEWHIWATGAVE